MWDLRTAILTSPSSPRAGSEARVSYSDLSLGGKSGTSGFFSEETSTQRQTSWGTSSGLAYKGGRITEEGGLALGLCFIPRLCFHSVVTEDWPFQTAHKVFVSFLSRRLSGLFVLDGEVTPNATSRRRVAECRTGDLCRRHRE